MCMRIFETYRNLIDKLDLDDQKYLKISKIEAILKLLSYFSFLYLVNANRLILIIKFK